MLFRKWTQIVRPWLGNTTHLQRRTRRLCDLRLGTPETLEVRALMEGTVGTTVTTAATTTWDQATADRVSKLLYTQFGTLRPTDVPYLTNAQLAGIPSSAVLISIPPAARYVLSGDQVQQLPIIRTGLNGLTPLQIESLTVAQIQSLKVADFPRLSPTQTPSLSAPQLLTINSTLLLRGIPAASRAALTPDQIRAIPVNLTGLTLLTDHQIEALTVPRIQLLAAKDVAQLLPSQTAHPTAAQWTAYAGIPANAAAPATQVVGDLTVKQIRELKYWDFKRLTAAQSPFLTTRQIGSIPNDWWFKQMTAEARAALSVPQMRGLMVASVGIGGLTPLQITQLSNFQVQALNYNSIDELPTVQIVKLTGDQLATIPNNWWFQQIPAGVRAALNALQVKSLNVAALGLSGLTAAQVVALSANQILSLSYGEFHLLTAAQTSLLSPAQIATIPNSWWFGRWTPAARAALKPLQVQGLNVAAVGISQLTAPQIAQLSASQVRQLNYSQFEFLNAAQTPLLTESQLQSIPNRWWFQRIPAVPRAAITATQVRMLNVGVVGLEFLTAAQIAALTPEQVRTVGYQDFRFLPATQTPHLSAEQLATIPNSWWFKQSSDAARAALTASQVQALLIENVGLEGLNQSQINALTTDQVQDVKYSDFDQMTPAQAPHLSAEQLASIPNSWWFSQMPAVARAALTDPQVEALIIDAVGLDYLTSPQVGFLTLEQIHDVVYSDFDRLHVDQIDDLNIEQVASIPNTWWFDRIAAEVRAALTETQIQALDVADIDINHLTAPQRDQLSVEQVQAIDHAWFFRFLTADQVEHLTTEQMALFENEWQFHSMTDTAQVALSREQLLAIPERVHAQMLDLHTGMFAPAAMTDDHNHTTATDGHDHSTTTTTTTPTTPGLPHQDDPAKQKEHLALFALVPREAATFVTIASGNWNDVATWRDGVIPNAGAQVLVSTGHTVTFNTVQTDAMRWVRVDGTLQFSTNIDTQLFVDTIIVDGAGTFRMGNDAAPIASGVAARLVIADNGQNIDQTWDPLQLSRGLISHGTTEMHGETVTPYVSLNSAPRGATQLTLDAIPTNWRVGDRLVFTGTSTDIKAKQDEELELVAINGNTITIDADNDVAGVQGLKFHHQPPAGFDLKVYIADMNRNVVVMSQNPAITQRRGHVMFMHSQKVDVENVGFYGLGRTDKRNPTNDPVIRDGAVLATTGLNPRGRYAVHFHRTGVDGTKTAAHISGSTVVDSPGWGMVNHDSNVNMLDNVAFNIQGASFVTEVGSEIGSMVRNLSIRSEGSGDGLEDRQDIFDFGHGGHGFWFQGPGVEVVDNISASSAEAAFIFFTASSEAQFDADNLEDPTLAAGHDHVPVGTVPLKRVDGNIAFAASAGLETWFHLTHMNDGQSYIDNMTTWNTNRGFFNPYTGRTTIRDAVVLGRVTGGSVWGTAFGRNNVTNNMTYENVRAEGWEVGIDVPVNRATVIRDGVFRAVRAIQISSTEDLIRTVDIVGDPQFIPLTTTQLGNRQQFEIYLNGGINLKNRDIETYFSPDIIRLGTVRFNDHQVYYYKQAANYVPFPSSATETLTWLPPELINKTNQQLWDEYGIAPAGVIAPADALQIDGINGLVGSRATYLPELDLKSKKYSNQLNDYRLTYADARGDTHVDPATTTLREGWNLLTRQIDGQTRTFFVYGDTKAPVFILDPKTDLRVNPLGLEFGIVIRGTVLDDSFGEMHFRREFKDLRGYVIKTDVSGKKYLTLEFSVNDLAGNVTPVVLKVFLDPTVPIVPGTNQRDLPPREVPVTLSELLEYYFLTGQTFQAP